MTSRFIIYALTEPDSGIVRYIGKSSSGLRRPRQHAAASSLRVDDHRARWIRQLIAAGRAYGIRVLEVCDRADDLFDAERAWIARGRGQGWPLTNILDGGGIGATGWKPSPEARAKMAARAKGRPKSAAHRAALAESQRGRTMPEATREKIRDRAKARAADPAERARLATLRLGATNSPEMRAKLRAANLGLVHSPERRARNAEVRRGIPLSEETRRRMSASQRERWARRRADAEA